MSDDVEKILLSKLMNKQKDYYDNHEALQANLFNNAVYKDIYNWLDAEYQQGNKFDMIKACNDLSHIKNITYVLGSLYSDNATWSYHTKSCIEHLKNVSKRDAIKNLCHDVLSSLEDKDVSEHITMLENTLVNMNRSDNGGIVDLRTHMKQTVALIEKNSLSQGLSGIPSGFPSIDKFTGGWQPQDLIIVGGASSMGKTSFALALAYNAALSGCKSAVFSYEMSSNQLVSRIISNETGIDNRYLIKGTLTDGEWSSIHSSMGRIEKVPMFIDECSNTSLRYLMNKVRQYVITKGVKLVMVDYLQLVSNLVKGRSREQEVSIIARSLKNLAKELDITIIALSQLSRGVERNEGSRPMLSNLRESGEIEQAADAVLFVYRPEYYGIIADHNGNNIKGMAEIIFAKGRNIGIGSKWLRWINYLTKFEELSDKDKDMIFC